MIALMMNLAMAEATNPKNNILVKPWKTPLETPPFDKIKNEDFKPAVTYALKESRSNVKKIVKNKDIPGFENTIVALSKSTELLDRVTELFFNLNECNTNDEMQQIALDISPDLTRFANEVSMNAELFAKVKAVYDRKDSLSLNGEQKMLLQKTYKSFIRNGALLSPADKEKMMPLQEELAMLSLKFAQNALADKNAWFLHITKRQDLVGLPINISDAAAETAKSKGLDGWVITLDYPSYGPFLQYAHNRDLREKVWRALNTIGNHGNANDNNEIVKRMAYLRLQVARLLGYNTYSDYVLEERMAESKDTVNKFLNDLLALSHPYAVKDVAEVQEYAQARGVSYKLERWDWALFSEMLKNEKYAINQEMLRPYFQLEKVRDGIFYLFGRLYDIKFVQRTDIPVYHPDVLVYEVVDKISKKTWGVLYLDFFPRNNKSSGAWMTSFNKQYKENGKDIRPQIQIVCNFTKPTPKQPSLLTFDEFSTFLHEFGHAIHGLLSDVNYGDLSGTSVYRDFVELPSQLMENWATQREFLDIVAEHYETGEKIPQVYIDRILESEKYNAGYFFDRQIGFGLLDMAWHSIEDSVSISVEEFEKKALAPTDVLPQVPGCLLSTNFSHVFAGGYAAGYYGYKWAEVLEADVFARFQKNGIFDKKTAKALRDNILSKGGTEHPMNLYINFMGRRPDMNPLLIKSGFLPEKK